MSSSLTIELATSVAATDLDDRLRSLWSGDFLRVCVKPNDETVLCHFGFYYPGKSDIEVEHILAFLMQISTNHRIYYYRSSSTITETIDWPEPIKIADVVTTATPGDYDGVQYRYLITQD